jgi:hypothetical protein
MTYRLLVTLDTATGVVRRWRRGERGRAEKLGEDRFPRWLSVRDLEDQVYKLLQDFRAAWTPPETPTPSAPPTQRVAKAA